LTSVLIIYGSTGGNTELVCDKIAEILENKRFKIKKQRAELTENSDLKNYEYIILAGSTYGQGLLQDHMKRFINNLKSLKGKKCAVIGLGDSKYNVEYVIESANLLEKAVKENNGELLIKPLRVNKTPVPHLDKMVKDWAQKLSKSIE